MKRNRLGFILALCMLAAANASAAVRYVDRNSASPTPPYASWATAATNIQDAVDAAVAGDQILVTNGVYQSGVTNQSRVVVDKPVTVQSVNGPQFTTIQGGLMIRCVYLANGTLLAGFTLTNGNVFFGGLGGGVAFGNLPSDAIVSNCVIVGCAAGWGGGAASAVSSGGPPGISGGTLLNCTFKGNLANGAPGGFGFPPASGGAADGCKLINCTITGNTAAGPSAAQGGGASSCVLQNCLLTGNSAVQGPGGGASFSDLINCTVVSNSASFVGGTYASYLRNCIVYYNSDPDHAADNYVKYSCTTPLADGPGNITNAPLFVNAGAGDYRLQAGSPCINLGNNDYVAGSVDVEGKERIVGGTVDMGAYEWIDRPTHYVSLNSPNPTPPYLSWSAAATNIQDAMDAAMAGAQILVTNGAYQTGGKAVFGTTNRVAADKPLSIQSVNGPEVTLINGGGVARCAYLTNGALLSGFTLTNGVSVVGGGVFCQSQSATVSNCVIVGNRATNNGGGASGGTLNNCFLIQNSAVYGGGAFGNLLSHSILNNCVLRGNSALYGGGAYVQGGSLACLLNNCTLTGNSATGELNFATGDFGGGGAIGCRLLNCIVYYNQGTAAENHNQYHCVINYSCTTPFPSSGVGHITNAPLFVDQAGGNLRLESNSPCINSGFNAYASAGPDLDGNPRIAGVTVDMGAYEFHSPASVISYAWLQRYGFPTDGSADYSDSDSDRLNNWQEWIAGTIPTDALSALRLLNPTSNASGINVSWQSVSNRTYFLERAANLGAAQPFSLLTGNIVGQVGTTSYTDTNASGPGPFFYRVGVQ